MEKLELAFFGTFSASFANWICWLLDQIIGLWAWDQMIGFKLFNGISDDDRKITTSKPTSKGGGRNKHHLIQYKLKFLDNQKMLDGGADVKCAN